MTSVDDNGGPVAREREAKLALDVLLTDANRLRARGRLADGVAKCREAIGQDGDFWPAYELMGDLLRQQGRAVEAIEAYQAAKALNQRRVALEDKIARACVVLARQNYAMEDMAELLRGQRPRKPLVAAVLSLVFPGLGQLYNRDYVKAVVIFGAGLMTIMSLGGAALSALAAGHGVYSVQVIASAFLTGKALYLGLLVTVLWVYALADATVEAGKSARRSGPLGAAVLGEDEN